MGPEPENARMVPKGGGKKIKGAPRELKAITQKKPKKEKEDRGDRKFLVHGGRKRNRLETAI